MARNRAPNVEKTKNQLAVFSIIILFAVDAVNPVKVLCHVFPWLLPLHITSVCLLLIVYLFISELKEILYWAVTVFFQSILSICFRDIDVVGVDNIPRHGPVIFSINHANQFMDALMIACSCQRKCSYLMAQKSYERRIVGDLAWALDVVPVMRAQDAAEKGTGRISIELDDDDNNNATKPTTQDNQQEQVAAADETHKYVVKGYETDFVRNLRLGDKIRPPGTSKSVKITSIESPTLLRAEASDPPEEFRSAVDKNNEQEPQPVAFDILRRVDQKQVYSKVLEKLASGGAIGIFPEGGSHDRTDLLPLKVGVALIAYSALEQDGIAVPIVPVGLNYFHAHRWRGRAVVEYGRPIFINPSTLGRYKMGGQERRSVCNEMLERVQDSMRSVIVSTPDYETLQLIHTARRLYQRKGQLDTSAKQDLHRRFAEGYRRLLLSTDGSPPKKWLELQERMTEYRNELRELGVRDYQVPGLSHSNDEIDADKVLKGMQLPYQILHLVFVLALATVPTLFINLPVGLLAEFYSESRRKVLLARSKVKIHGFDVMLTEKVVFCIAMVPLLWLSYGLALSSFTNFDGPTLALAILSMPYFAYIGIIASEAGMIDLKDLRPWIMLLFPSSRVRLAALPETRKLLQSELRAFVREIGPALAGDIYFGKKIDWQSIQKSRRTSDFSTTKESKKVI